MAAERAEDREAATTSGRQARSRKRVRGLLTSLQEQVGCSICLGGVFPP